MKELFFILDDLQQPPKEIKEIIGEQSFGKMILRRNTLEERYKALLKSYDWVYMMPMCSITKHMEKLVEKISEVSMHSRFIHVYSDQAILNMENFHILIQKMPYVHETVAIVSQGTIGAFVFADKAAYLDFLMLRLKGGQREALLAALGGATLQLECFWNIALKTNFLSYISSSFDARFFNSLSGDAYILTKRSSKKEKIKSEYMYYHLLPDSMKMWFVRPFDYVEKNGYAQYSMERYHMADLAIRWIHGSLVEQEFSVVMKKVFHFICNRVKKTVDVSAYQEMQHRLYIEKVRTRMKDLRTTRFYPALEKLLTQVDIDLPTTESHTSDLLEKILEKYEQLYKTISEIEKTPFVAVVGHGDLCFSNILYSSEISLLRFIDPKGALNELDLWTDPYYDLAKLSHSICGRYDFFNAGLYDIVLDENLRFRLMIDFDHANYIKLFQNLLEANGFSYLKVRLFETSLFLSMLPLHVDVPKKVFAFLLNALDIMKEIEAYMKNKLIS